MTINILDLEFATAKACLRFCSEMLARYGAPAIVSVQDSRFLEALLQRHPKHREKVGVGINHFEVRLKKFGVPCFHVVRADGSIAEFSYKKAVRGF